MPLPTRHTPAATYLSLPNGAIWEGLVTPRLSAICFIVPSAEPTYLLGGMWSPMTRPILVPQWWQPSLHARRNSVLLIFLCIPQTGEAGTGYILNTPVK